MGMYLDVFRRADSKNDLLFKFWPSKRAENGQKTPKIAAKIPYGNLKRERAKLYVGNFGTGKATEEFKVSMEAYGRATYKNGFGFPQQNFKN